jgi:hypothetical protein
MDPSASCVPESYNKVKLKETDRKRRQVALISRVKKSKTTQVFCKRRLTSETHQPAALVSLKVITS